MPGKQCSEPHQQASGDFHFTKNNLLRRNLYLAPAHSISSELEGLPLFSFVGVEGKKHPGSPAISPSGGTLQGWMKWVALGA